MKQQMENTKNFYDAIADFHLLVYLAKNLESGYMNHISEFIVTKQNESSIKELIVALLKNVKTSPEPTTTTSSKPKSHPQEQQWIAALTSMGFSATQAQEALWATSYQGIEAAIDFLSR